MVTSEELGPLAALRTQPTDDFGRGYLIDPRHLETLTGRTGYKNVALDVLVMAQVLVDHWPVVQDKTPLTVADLDHAEDVAQRLVVASAQQQHTPPAFIEATSIRQRAFTLLARSYNHARRAVAFLRWNEGDAENVAPSLYKGRRANRAKEDILTPPDDRSAVTRGTDSAPKPVDQPAERSLKVHRSWAPR